MDMLTSLVITIPLWLIAYEIDSLRIEIAKNRIEVIDYLKWRGKGYEH